MVSLVMLAKNVRKLVLIRHGETDWNLESRRQGWSDVSLNATGERQAELLGRYVREQMQIDRVITSHLKRCVQTAEALGTPYELDARLREFNTGVLTGKTKSDMKAEHGESANDIINPRPWVRRPEGESGSDVAARAAAFTHESGVLKQDSTWALITHDGFIRSMICVLLDLPFAYRTKLKVSNTGISVLTQSTVDPEAPVVLETLNFMGHLTPGHASDTV